jgi:hypothetical protein
MEFVPEIPKIFLTVGVFVWIFTYFIGKIPIVTKYLCKENIALCIGIIVIITGILTNYFNTDPMTAFIYGIIAIYITMTFHDKTVEAIKKNIEKVKNNKGGISG